MRRSTSSPQSQRGSITGYAIGTLWAGAIGAMAVIFSPLAKVNTLLQDVGSQAQQTRTVPVNTTQPYQDKVTAIIRQTNEDGYGRWQESLREKDRAWRASCEADQAAGRPIHEKCPRILQGPDRSA